MHEFQENRQYLRKDKLQLTISNNDTVSGSRSDGTANAFKEKQETNSVVTWVSF